jgi:GNAT superfamily N-acetyltransferase
VAESVAGIVGFISTHATRDEDQDSDRIGEVGAIYVRPDLWGRGVGQMLMKLGIEALKASGFSTATLWTLRDADQARRFYEAGGWQLDGADKDLLLDAPVALIRYRVSLADF